MTIFLAVINSLDCYSFSLIEGLVPVNLQLQLEIQYYCIPIIKNQKATNKFLNLVIPYGT